MHFTNRTSAQMLAVLKKQERNHIGAHSLQIPMANEELCFGGDSRRLARD